jgi:hypothetical protein
MGKAEGVVQMQIRQFLEAKGFKVLRQQSGVFRGHVGLVRVGEKGVSDLIACSPSGAFIAVEVKKPGGKPTEEQLDFIDEINKRGGVALVADNLGDVIQALNFEN